MKIALPMSIELKGARIYINQAYVNYIMAAGLKPVLLSPGMDIATIMAEVDGLLLPGGIDIDPVRYGEDNYSCIGTDPAKDEFEISMMNEALLFAKPIFGICRGFQLLAREFLTRPVGYALMQDHNVLRYAQNINFHSQTDNTNSLRSSYSHYVLTLINRLYSIENDDVKTRIPVNSMHHQCLVVSTTDDSMNIMTHCLQNSPESLEILASTARGTNREKEEAVVEAFKINGWGSRVLAVQWHPEELMDIELLRNFFLAGNPNVLPVPAKIKTFVAPARVRIAYKKKNIGGKVDR